MPLINHAGGGGGTPQLCSQVENFKVIPGSTALSARLSWEAPTVDEDSSFVGVRIVRKAGSVPEKVSDGTVVYEGTALTYTDTGLTAGTTYYYRAFAYNAKKKYQTARRVVSLTATTITLGATLNDCTWAQIRAASAAGLAASIWSVGDTKSISITNYYGTNGTPETLQIDVYIIGFNHNSAQEGSNRIHFKIGKQNGKQVGLCYSPYGTGSHEVEASTLQQNLPSALTAVLQSTVKYNLYNKTVESESLKVALLGCVELLGAKSNIYAKLEGKQVQYDYYKAGNSILHFLNNDLTINWSTGTKDTGSFRLRDKGYRDYRYNISNNGAEQYTDATYDDCSVFIFFV